MDKFVTSVDGVEVDLDDLEIYTKEWLELKSYDLWMMAWKEAGMSLFYMQFLHPPESGWGVQAPRIHYMCRQLVVMRVSVIKDSSENRLKVMKWLFRFQEEVENQC